MTLHLSFYATRGGSRPVRKYIDALDEGEAARLYAALGHLESAGLKAAGVEYRAIAGKLWELKIGRHRVFYVLMTRSELVLLHACKKQGRKARKEEVALAMKRMREVWNDS